MSKEKGRAYKKTTIGGQALIEGILMRGPKKTSIVVRKTDGEMVNKIEEVGTNTHPKFCRWPLVRGVVTFWDSMKYGVSALMYSASFFEDEEEVAQEPGKFEAWLSRHISNDKLEKIMMTIAVVMGVAMPVVLFILLPTFIIGLLGDHVNQVLRSVIEGVVRITIFLLFIIVTSRLKDIKRTYMYHGAEHKTIHCYEHGEELTVENVRKYTRLHPRCGTSFLFVVVIVSIIVSAFIKATNPFLRMGIHLLLLPVVVGLSYEVNRFAGRHDNWLTKVLRAPGMFLQHFTTYEPDDSMIEVGIEALKSVIPETENEDNW